MSTTLSYTYQSPILGSTVGMLARSDGAYIPCNLENSDYQAFLTWVAAGNTAPEGWTGPVNPVPA
jgi:hypothetical protein